MSTPDDSRVRSPYSRTKTAYVVAISDLVTISVVVVTESTGLTSSGRVGGVASLVLNIGLTAVFLRLLGLMTETGAFKALWGLLGWVTSLTWSFGGSILKEDDTASPPSTVNERWKERAAFRSEYLDGHRRAWYSTLGLGVIGQLLIVGSTGGITASPFAEIFLATFILGQFRAPNREAIWLLFGFGVVSVGVTQVVAVLVNRASSAADHFEFSPWAHLLPLLLVALLSTAVSHWNRDVVVKLSPTNEAVGENA